MANMLDKIKALMVESNVATQSRIEIATDLANSGEAILEKNALCVYANVIARSNYKLFVTLTLDKRIVTNVNRQEDGNWVRSIGNGNTINVSIIDIINALDGNIVFAEEQALLRTLRRNYDSMIGGNDDFVDTIDIVDTQKEISALINHILVGSRLTIFSHLAEEGTEYVSPLSTNAQPYPVKENTIFHSILGVELDPVAREQLNAAKALKGCK